MREKQQQSGRGGGDKRKYTYDIPTLDSGKWSRSSSGCFSCTIITTQRLYWIGC